MIPGWVATSQSKYCRRPTPTKPSLVKTITAAEIAAKAGYSRPHTVHCGPDGIYITALANALTDILACCL